MGRCLGSRVENCRSEEHRVSASRASQEDGSRWRKGTDCNMEVFLEGALKGAVGGNLAGAERKEKLALPLQGGPAHTCTHLPVFVSRRERTQAKGATVHLMETGMQRRQRAGLTLDGKTGNKGSPGPKHEGRDMGGTRKSKLRDRHKGGCRMRSTPSIPSSRGSARPHLCHCHVLRGVASFMELQVRD